MDKLTGYLRLMRPANIVTAIADILAGVAIAWSLVFSQINVFCTVSLALSTAFLYGGGVVLNDVFDAELDKIERPERPIPCGLIPKRHAAVFGMILLLLGITCAALCNQTSALLAGLIAIAAVVYDKWMKHHSFLGPLNMGICRGLNLLLGMSIYPAAIEFYWFIALVPIIYIFAITMISRGEVHGGKKTTMYLAAFLYTTVIAAILFVSYKTENYLTLPFIVLFAIMIFMPLLKAIEKPEGPQIGHAVKSGVIALIVMNAAWAAAFGDMWLALIIIVLLPVSIMLGRLFAVT